MNDVRNPLSPRPDAETPPTADQPLVDRHGAPAAIAARRYPPEPPCLRFKGCKSRPVPGKIGARHVNPLPSGDHWSSVSTLAPKVGPANDEPLQSKQGRIRET